MPCLFVTTFCTYFAACRLGFRRIPFPRVFWQSRRDSNKPAAYTSYPCFPFSSIFLSVYPFWIRFQGQISSVDAEVFCFFTSKIKKRMFVKFTILLRDTLFLCVKLNFICENWSEAGLIYQNFIYALVLCSSKLNKKRIKGRH